MSFVHIKMELSDKDKAFSQNIDITKNTHTNLKSDMRIF